MVQDLLVALESSSVEIGLEIPVLIDGGHVLVLEGASLLLLVAEESRVDVGDLVLDHVEPLHVEVVLHFLSSQHFHLHQLRVGDVHVGCDLSQLADLRVSRGYHQLLLISNSLTKNRSVDLLS